MHRLYFFTSLLGLASAWPHPSGSGTGQVSSSTISRNISSSSKTSNLLIPTGYSNTTSSCIKPTGHSSSTSRALIPTGLSTTSRKTTTSPAASTSAKSSTASTEIITIPFEVTSTRTSFVPVSSSVSQTGGLTYYSTWLSVTYPTTIFTSTEYVTRTIQPTSRTTLTSVFPVVTPMITYQCVCPLPVTETVYINATDVPAPASTITSAVMHTYTSTLPNGQTATTVVPVSPPTTISIAPPSSISQPSSTKSESTRSTNTRYSGTGTGGFTRPTNTGPWIRPTSR